MIVASFYAVFLMNKKRFLLPASIAAGLITAVLFLLLFLPRISGSAADNTKFEHFTDDFFCKEITNSTLSLHYTLKDPSCYNLKNYSVSFGDASVEGRADELRYLKDTKKSLSSFSYHNLSKSQQLTYDLLLDSLDSQIALAKYELYEEPFTPNNGIHAQLPILLAEYAFSDQADIEEYLALLEQVDVYFSQLLDFESEKAHCGKFMSDEQCESVIESCEQFLENRQNNLLLTSFENRIASVEGLSAEEQASYISKNGEMFWNHVRPAYENVIHRMTALLGSGKNDWGLCNYEDGADYYTLLVHTDTGTSESMDELFEKISSERDKDLSLCSEIIAKHPEFASNSYDYDWSYANEIDMLDTLETALCKDFPTPLVTSYRINYVAEDLQDALAPAFYITAPIDDYSDNCIYINNAKNYSDIHYFTTLAHEGFPGHLYQTTMTYNYGIPSVRALLDYPGYVEGWATYVELMSYHYAGLDEDLATLLSHNQAATLSLYAASDIGIHYYGWETKELIDFWSRYGITDTAVINDIAKLILADPGNYLKYYVGYLKFEELQTEMERKYGDNFSLMDFHEAILRIGPAQFDILSKYFPSYYTIARSEK